MKRVLATLLCLLLALSMVVMAACDGGEGPDPVGPDDGHVHTYKTGTEWSKDANSHWYEATCDCADAPLNKLNHVKGENGLCEVCKFALCEHTYSEDWTADCTNHWNAADCGCIVAGQNLAAHVDENNDGECDVCKYVIEDLHTHYYATEWTTDGEYHWHAALCEHGAEVADKAAHEINAAGYCTVCAAKIREVDRADMLAVLNASIANNHKVVNGTVTFAELVDDGADGKINEVFYTLGNDASYIFYNSYGLDGTYRGGDQQWYERLGEDDYFGVQMVAGSRELVPAAGGAQFMNGYNYTPGQLLARGYEDTSTLSQTIANMYDQMHNGENVLSKEEAYDPETGIYSFQYVIFAVDAHTYQGEVYEYAVELYSVSVEFRVNEDFVIYLANIGVATYRNWELDMDLSYNPETNEVALFEDATATVYAYEVSQTSGERTYTTIYPKSSFMPVDFDLFYVTSTDYNDEGILYIVSEELVENNTITLKPEEYVRLHLGNPIPAAALLSFMDTDDFSMTYVNKNSGESGELWADKDFLRPSFSGYMDCIAFKVKDAGEYTVTITFGEVTKTLDVIVPGVAPVVVPENTADTFYVKTTDTYTYADEYTFVAPESGTYTFTIPAGLGFEVGDDNISDYYSESAATYRFTLAQGKSLTFRVGAVEKNVVFAIGIAFEAHDVEDSGDDEGGEEGGSGTIGDIAGTYYANGLTLVIGDGTMVLTKGETVSNYTYEINDGVITYVLNNGNPYTADGMMAPYFGYLTFDGEGKPATFVYDGSTHTLTTTPPADGGDEGGEEGGDGDDVTPNGSGTDEDPFILTEPGDYTCAFGGGWNAVWYTINVKVGGYITVSSDFATNWIQVGANIYAVTSNSGNGQPVKVYFPAGSTAYIGIADWDEQVADIPFTVSFEEVIPGDFSHVVGSWIADTLWGSTYELVINADGTGTYTENEYGAVEYALTYVVAADGNILIGYANDYNAGSMSLTVSGETLVYEPDAYTSLVFAANTGSEEGGEEGGDEGDDTVDYATVIVEGANTLYFSADEVAANTATRPLTITAAGDYKFAAGTLFISAITDANGNTIAKNSDYTYTLAAGEYTVTFGMFSTFGVKADIAQTLNATNENPATEGGDEGDGEGDDEGEQGGQGTGTSSDPYIVGELPFTFSYIGAHDCYYKLTVTEDCVISIAYTAGSYVSGLPGSAEYDVANRVYTFSMTAGSSLVFNPWTTSAAATEYVYTVSKVEAPAGGEEGGEEGGEGETGAVLTYISAVATNGRKMKVEIDKAANTMIVTRSDATGNFTGGATSVTFTSYAEVVAGTASAQSGNAMIQGFDANGVPTSIAWMGVIFTDFVQQ